MEIQIKDSIRTEEYPASAQMVKKIKETHGGIYVTAEDAPQFVALPIEEFDQLLRQQKRLILREQYIRDRIEAGLSLQELQALLSRLDQLDQAWLADPGDKRQELIAQSEASFRQYCEEQGAVYDEMDEEAIGNLLDTLIQRVRTQRHEP
jgi:hypothetical protein